MPRHRAGASPGPSSCGAYLPSTLCAARRANSRCASSPPFTIRTRSTRSVTIWRPETTSRRPRRAHRDHPCGLFCEQRSSHPGDVESGMSRGLKLRLCLHPLNCTTTSNPAYGCLRSAVTSTSKRPNPLVSVLATISKRAVCFTHVHGGGSSVAQKFPRSGNVWGAGLRRRKASDRNLPGPLPDPGQSADAHSVRGFRIPLLAALRVVHEWAIPCGTGIRAPTPAK